MTSETESMVSITDTENDLSKVLEMADKHGTAVIMQNNRPRYIVIDACREKKIEFAPDEKVEAISEKFLQKYHKMFEELAK